MATNYVLIVVTMTILCCCVSAEQQNSSEIALRSERGKMYHVYTNMKLNYYKAMTYCLNAGMALATIESQEDQDIFESVVKRTKIPGVYFWTSGNDLGEDWEWIWASTGQPFTYTNWRFGQPDHSRGFLGEVDHCVGVESNSNFKWSDWKCSVEEYAVCQFY